MFEALRCVRGTKALNFSVFLIPNLAHPLIRWVPEEPGSSPHGRAAKQYRGKGTVVFVQPIAFMLARGDLKNSSRTLAAAPEMHGASRLARGPGGGGEQ